VSVTFWGLPDGKTLYANKIAALFFAGFRASEVIEFTCFKKRPRAPKGKK
jgi:hypothetical protein